MTALRKRQAGSDSFGNVWPHDGAVIDVDPEQAAILVRIADSGITEASADEVDEVEVEVFAGVPIVPAPQGAEIVDPADGDPVVTEEPAGDEPKDDEAPKDDDKADAKTPARRGRGASAKS